MCAAGSLVHYVLRGAGGALVLVIYDEFKKLIDANL